MRWSFPLLSLGLAACSGSGVVSPGASGSSGANAVGTSTAGTSSGGGTGSSSPSSGTATGTTGHPASTGGSSAATGGSSGASSRQGSSGTSGGGTGSSSGGLDAGPDAGVDAGPSFTAEGVPLPVGWSLQVSDHFGTDVDAGANVTSYAQLHAKYNEGQFYNVDAQGLVDIPNVVINGEQETYVHFEQGIVFATDHLTIQGRGHPPDGGLSSAELVSLYTARSFCVEARYQIPSVAGSWPAFWHYASASGNDTSELDVEQPITPNQGVTSVSLYNHPPSTNVTVIDSLFTTPYMTWTNPQFDGSAAPHVYTNCYDDGTQTVTRFIDGAEIYSAAWQWNASLGGTGHGPDACTIVNLAVGGSWPGDIPDPTAYSADLDLYSIDYYGP